MSEVYWIEDCVQIIANDDGSWSVTDNGEETDDLEYNEAMRLALEFILTDEDIDAWHNGDGMTPRLASAWRNFPSRRVFQIWGSRDGAEPLSVIVTNEEVPA